MVYYVKTLDGATHSLTSSVTDVLTVKQHIATLYNAPSYDLVNLHFQGKLLLDNQQQLSQLSEAEENVLYASLDLLGGGKKRKKKTYTKPKKIKHKHKKVKLAVLKYYKVSDDGKVTHLRRECPGERCGAGIFMGNMKDRHYCGRCHLTLVEE
mmetsp:Transcript_607/g.1059  ORF Transcript_607/g.1059 Transcript_607/m.1059 type:complete len:153 (-) Transcript_607:199-657(-)|eukprot:CAMPEP_0184699962 /NCGR_PEP_ID=MMETSP0313-20130426/6718_1 /TAXON_ID=2792 /ORGANISM="Porphyridium aerugineum, Strain SAG 1380-2" /LENGTH=152 /DNA_ID=CAMNT_0027159205 /DNA_START=63 /DNA_END=521 /DNA_ORIENTATION=+